MTEHKQDHFAADPLTYAIALGVFDVLATKLDPPAGGAVAGELGERVALAFMAEADRRREAEPDALLDTKELAVVAVDGALVGLEAGGLSVALRSVLLGAVDAAVVGYCQLADAHAKQQDEALAGATKH